jgi:predicted AlkP superfamily pyrophosphatase or phosphodiesterase
MHRSLWTALLSILLLPAACTPPSLLRTEASELRKRPDPLLLISIDGFRPDYLERGLTPTLVQLAREGVRAESMQPAFPSLTFPNHYTLVTGLTPDHHGIVSNTMVDPEIPGRFSLSNHIAADDQRWWNEATPIWISADRAGLRTATMFWPGSEAPIHGMHPDYWKPFDASVTPTQRVDQILAWLDLPPHARPRFLTLYFDGVDHQAHERGPDSTEVNAALATVDEALARLLAGLNRRGLEHHINLVIVSDHGMAATPPQQLVKLDDLINGDAIDVLTLGALAGLHARPGHEHEVAAALLKPHSHMQCWAKNAVPPRLLYGHNPRVPAIVCLANVGWQITTRDAQARWKDTHLGEHGYDNAAPEMRALFVANGPAFVCGAVLKPFPNVDVYPMLAHLLHIQPLPNDGDLAPLRPALRDTAPRSYVARCPASAIQPESR